MNTLSRWKNFQRIYLFCQPPGFTEIPLQKMPTVTLVMMNHLAFIASIGDVIPKEWVNSYQIGK